MLLLHPLPARSCLRLRPRTDFRWFARALRLYLRSTSDRHLITDGISVYALRHMLPSLQAKFPPPYIIIHWNLFPLRGRQHHVDLRGQVYISTLSS